MPVGSLHEAMVGGSFATVSCPSRRARARKSGSAHVVNTNTAIKATPSIALDLVVGTRLTGPSVLAHALGLGVIRVASPVNARVGLVGAQVLVTRVEFGVTLEPHGFAKT